MHSRAGAKSVVLRSVDKIDLTTQGLQILVSGLISTVPRKAIIRLREAYLCCLSVNPIYKNMRMPYLIFGGRKNSDLVNAR
jgi:hypothetical protein